MGKTSLLNAMFPGMRLATQSVSAATAKGRHTTTQSRLYPLPHGGYLADTPGIRTLGLFHEDQERIDDVFPEVYEHAANCRFKDCSHTHEPDCAVKCALEQGMIDEDRYQNYLRMSRTKGG